MFASKPESSMKKKLLNRYLKVAREIESLFPLEVDGFPTMDIRKLVDDCEYDESLELAEPLLGRYWMDVPAKHWFENYDSSCLLTADAIAYYFPSILRFIYLERAKAILDPNILDPNAERFCFNRLTEEFYSYLFCADNLSHDAVDEWRERRVKNIYSKYNVKQLKIVKEWLISALDDTYTEPFSHALAMQLINQALKSAEEACQ